MTTSRNLFLRVTAILLAGLSGVPSAHALPPPGPPSPTEWPALADQCADGPRRFATTHVGTFGGRIVRYRATVAETIVNGPDGKPAASVFTTAFTADPASGGPVRPVVFVFNGGPGGASNMLLLGAFGPKRVTSVSSKAMADPATPLVDNGDSILDVADLVFIDPADTGFSRRLDGVPPRLFLSIDGDSFEFGQVILHWLRANGRLASPKYLAGESYGTLRSVALARDLSRATPRVEFDGIILISQAITYSGPSSFAIKRTPDPMRAIARLPDVTAAAWFHGRIDNRHQTVEQAIAKTQAFARTEYAEALILGNRLDPERRQRVAAQLEVLTGIPAAFYLEHRLRVDDYRHELLRGEGLALAQFDGRETEVASEVPKDEDRDWDAAVLGLTRNMERYAHDDLAVRDLGAYVTIVHDPYGYEEGWTYLVPPTSALDVVLAEVMKASPTLRLMVPQGLFDTTSSMGATLTLFAQLDIPRSRVATTYYAAGHMVYADAAALRKFAGDVRTFVAGGTPNGAYPPVEPVRRSPEAQAARDTSAAASAALAQRRPGSGLSAPPAARPGVP